ncbi:hypothetical protein BaRGS_00009518 [Batillaria attramentaria]|uniref:Uncharacterized protein n=1 Tax=Batillaria attramentaria TaxID=370345 RepID=A0ABD0LJC5_9CAEN
MAEHYSSQTHISGPPLKSSRSVKNKGFARGLAAKILQFVKMPPTPTQPLVRIGESSQALVRIGESSQALVRIGDNVGRPLKFLRAYENVTKPQITCLQSKLEEN